MQLAPVYFIVPADPIIKNPGDAYCLMPARVSGLLKILAPARIRIKRTSVDIQMSLRLK
jgi:hypothetical protein